MAGVQTRIGDKPSRNVRVEDLRRFMEAVLVRFGLPPESAKIVAAPFLNADLKGLYIQGLHHLIHSMVTRSLRNKRFNVTGRPRVVKEGPAFAIVEGDRAPGPLSGTLGADVAIRKAKEAGAAAVGVVNGGDMYMIGHYAERIAEAGIIGMVFVSAPPLIPPTGGLEEVIGTNPVAIGIPTDGAPMLADISCGAHSYWHIRDLAHYGMPLAPGIALGPDGRPTTEARDAVKGVMLPFAGAKGYGLALAGAFMAGGMLGCDMGKAMLTWRHETPGPLGRVGHLLLGVDPGAFGDAATFRRSAGEYLRTIKSSRKAPGVESIRVPGEMSFAVRARCIASNTVRIEETAWQRAVKVAEELNIPMPATA